MNENTSDFDLCTPRFKVVLLGEGAVGKSSILLRYIEDKFNSAHLSTLQVLYDFILNCCFHFYW